MSYKKEIGGLEMKAVTFSKTDKTKIITFVLVTYGLPWLFYPWVGSEGNGDIFPVFMMILPTFGIVAGRSICERKIQGWLHWIYIAVFTGYTVIMVLCTVGVISGEAVYDVDWIFMALSVVLLLGSLIEGKELYPFKDLIKMFDIYLIFTIIIDISYFPVSIRTEGASIISIVVELFSEFLLTPINILVMESIYFFGEEYAWRKCLQGRLQTIFGKRIGIIILGIVWELWHMPLWFSVYGFGKEKYFVMLVLVRILHSVGMAVFLGWAYMRTKNIWLCVLIHGFNNSAAYGFQWMTDNGLAENVSDVQAMAAVFISAVIMILFLFAKEYRKEERE